MRPGLQTLLKSRGNACEPGKTLQTDGVALSRRIDPTSVIQEIVVPATL